jgi:hypothetical protein
METRLIQVPSEQILCRISAGGRDGFGYYCIFSGEREEAVECLREVLKALEDPASPVEVRSDG